MTSTHDTLETACALTWDDYISTSASDRRRDRATVYSATAAARTMYRALEETETARERFDALLDVRATLRYLLEEIEPITTEAREQAGRDDARARDAAAAAAELAIAHSRSIDRARACGPCDACASGEESSTRDACAAR